MKKIFLTLVLCSFAGAMFAQGVKFGVTAGLNVSSLNVTNSGTTDISSKAGFQAGVLMDWGITKNFSIIPELNFSQKGAKLSDSEMGIKIDISTTLNYLTLPINAAYKFDLGMDQKLIVFAGPYLGYGLSINNKLGNTTPGVDIQLGESKFGSNEGQVKPFDFGANAGIGYQYTNIFFKVQGNWGLINMSNTNIADDNTKNFNLGVTVGYMF